MLNTHYFARATTRDTLFRELRTEWDLHYVDIALACSAYSAQKMATVPFLRPCRAVRINLPLCQKNDARRNFRSGTVELAGFEPTTPCLQSRCSTN